MFGGPLSQLLQCLSLVWGHLKILFSNLLSCVLFSSPLCFIYIVCIQCKYQRQYLPVP